jgi:hypothetical protein
MKPIPLFGWGVNAYSSYVSRQRRLNCFYEIRKDGDKNQMIVRGTPGVTTYITLPTAPIRGWHVVSNILYVAAGLTLYSVAINGAFTAIGGFDIASTGNVAMSDNGVQLLCVDGAAGYIYTIVTGVYAQTALNAAGSFGKITDVNFPNGASSVCFLDGRLIVNRPNSRQFYVSEFYDGTGWTNVYSLPTYGTKDNNSDRLISVSVLNGILHLHGEQSTEFWQNVGSTPLPFARVSGATRNLGIASQYSLAYIDDVQLFLGQSLFGGYVEVTLMQGFNMTRVSTEDIDNIIRGFTVWQDAIGFGYILDGHKMYQLTFPSAARSFLYDVSTQFWYDLQSGVGLTGRHIANFGITFNSFTYITDSTTGRIYKLDPNVYTDNGALIKRQVTSKHVTMAGNRFSIDEMYLDMETGTGLQQGQGTDPQIMLQVSKDGGRTFGIERWKPIGKVGQYKSPRVMWNRFGASQDFVFQWTMTDPVKFTIVGGAVKTRQQEGQDG